MPSIYGVKPKFQKLLRPIMTALADRGISPNMLTVAAFLGSAALGMLLTAAHRHPRVLLLLPPWLFARMALNALDGMMAREKNKQSSLGALINEVGDVLSDIALYLPLALFHQAACWAVIGFVLGAALTEFCGVTATLVGSPRRYDGPMGKSDRAFLVGTAALITATFPAMLGAWPALFASAAWAEAMTCWNRLRAALLR